MTDSARSVAYVRHLAACALAYTLLHHVGSLPDGLGETWHRTRWADWIDLLTPYAVLLPAALALRSAQVSGRAWSVFLVGALAYAQGHGIHLSANSIGNVDPGETAHFWDEAIGHYVWYAGVAVCGAVLVASMRGRERPTRPLAYLLAAGVGLTWATNAVGGGTRPASLLVALAAVVFGLQHRRALPAVTAVGFGLGALLLAVELVRDVV